MLYIFLGISLNLAHASTLLILGDSLSDAYNIDPKLNWVNLLSKKLEESHPDIKAVNLSQTGATTLDGLSRISLALTQYQASWLILELGGNDGLRGLPPPSVKQNLKKIIELAQKASVRKILVVGMTLPPNYGSVYIKAFENVYTELAQEFNLPRVPFLLEGVATVKNLMQSDGVHPTAEAQPIIFQNVWRVIEQSNFFVD